MRRDGTAPHPELTREGGAAMLERPAAQASHLGSTAMGLHQGSGHCHPERRAELVPAQRLLAPVEDVGLAFRGERRPGVPERQLAPVRRDARGEAGGRSRRLRARM